jgi:hypothetical protein
MGYFIINNTHVVCNCIIIATMINDIWLSMTTWNTHFVLYMHANLPTPLVHCQPPFRYLSLIQVWSISWKWNNQQYWNLNFAKILPTPSLSTYKQHMYVKQFMDKSNVSNVSNVKWWVQKTYNSPCIVSTQKSSTLLDINLHLPMFDLGHDP